MTVQDCSALTFLTLLTSHGCRRGCVRRNTSASRVSAQGARTQTLRTHSTCQNFFNCKAARYGGDSELVKAHVTNDSSPAFVKVGDVGT